MMFLVSLLSLPAGIAAAIYLEEYAPDNRPEPDAQHRHPQPGRACRRSSTASWAWPSSCWPCSDFTGGRTVIAGGLTLAVLVLPISIIVSAESLRAVPGQHP